MLEIESLEQNDITQQWNALIQEKGISRYDCIVPQQYQLQNNSHHLVLNPFDRCPEAKTLLVLMQQYTPIVLAYDQYVPFSAYYVASNQLYHQAKELTEWLLAQGYQAERIEIPAKMALLQTGRAEMGENTLLSVDALGTRFAIQWIVTEASIQAPKYEPNRIVCTHCQRCRKVCPNHAIDDNGFHEQQCLRYHMDGQIMPPWVKERMPSLFGCELCQLVCPRNAKQAPATMQEDWQEIFQFERLLFLSAADKKWIASLVGRNMLSRGRLRAQALSLALRFDPAIAKKAIQQWHEQEKNLTECEMDVMKSS